MILGETFSDIDTVVQSGNSSAEWDDQKTQVIRKLRCKVGKLRCRVGKFERSNNSGAERESAELDVRIPTLVNELHKTDSDG